jgi:tryptophan 2,3-dioxygenase
VSGRREEAPVGDRRSALEPAAPSAPAALSPAPASATPPHGDPLAPEAGSAGSEAKTYASYLRLDDLLGLQAPVSDGPEHDEVLFIVIHQVYELWFKLLLHELALLQRSLESGDTPAVHDTFKRMLTVLKILVAQVDVLETMTPVSFLTFRSRLDSASGFQSFQFRELELALGARSRGALAHHPPGPVRARLEERLRSRSLYDSFLRFLVGRGYAIPASALERELAEPPAENAEVQAVLIEIYRRDPATREVCERLVDLDEGLQEWRYRHVKMVERTIGTKQGTGGSPGAAYLKTTLSRPLFPDLWAIRSQL